MKSVWVIGASSGIGHALAEIYAQQDIVLYLSSRHIRQTEPDWRYAKADVRLVPLDLQNTKQCEAVTDRILRDNGPPELVIFAAGMIAYDDCWHMTEQLERRLFEVNYWGPVLITRRFLDSFICRRRGQLVYLGSIAGFVASPLRSTYAASKHALHGYVNATRAELAPYNIKVTLVCPGFVDTGIDQRAFYGNGELRTSHDENRLQGMSPQECAVQIIDGLNQGKDELHIGGNELAMLSLQRFFPALVRKLLTGFRPDFALPCSEFAALNSGSTEYYLYGQGRTKIVVVNGISSSFDVWWDVLRDIDRDKYQVLLYNYYGRGKSKTIFNAEPLSTLDTQLDELLAFVQWQPQDCHWVSFSWGCGWLNRWFLNRWFLNRACLPKSLTMVAPAFWHQAQIKGLNGLRFSSLGRRVFLIFGRWLLAADYRRYCNTPFVAKAFWKRIVPYVSRKSFLRIFTRQTTEDIGNWPNYFRDISLLMGERISAVRGADDGKSMDRGFTISAEVGVSKVIDVPGANHLLPLEASLVLARHIDGFISACNTTESGIGG